jgi:hypothetical protein
MPIFGPAGLNPTPNFNGNTSNKTEVISVRVRDIVLSPNHPKFEEVGGWSGLGTIFFSSISTPGLKSIGSSQGSAKPYFSNSKFYPLRNEIVTIIKATDYIASQNSKNREAQIFYYFPPVGGWGGINHNALPDPIQGGNVTTSPRKNYTQVEEGATNKEHVTTSKIYLGETFKENPKVKALYPYEGDYILEGRWGNSIRFGSTVKSLEVPNNWSSEGNEGDPIIILKNGNLPFPSTDPSYIPTVEDISNDLSSIYLTSTQKVQFFPSSFKTDSFGENDTPPTSPSEYQGNQILLTSGRLVLNAQSDGVLISSPSVIHLSAGNAIHLDSSDKIVLSSGEVYLIGRDAEERAVLGDQLILNLKLLLEVLEGVGMALTTANVDGVAAVSLNNVGPNLTEVVKDFKLAIEGDNPKILSKNVRLK